jgi:CPA2 family monovalent cation:H+ antiporter-2
VTTVETSGYGDVVLFLVTAGFVVPLFRQWKLSPILGFLAAGVLLGPQGLGALQGAVPWLSYFTIQKPENVAQLADLGVVFLLFSIGLELSWERLKSLRRLVFGLGGLQVAICTAVIAAVAIALGQDAIAASLLGMSLAFSSTAIVMPLLAEQKRQYTPGGRATFAILLLQDLAVAPLLVTIAFLGNRMGEGFSPRLLLAFAPAALGMVALVVLGRLALRPLMALVARARSEELFVAACLLVVVGAGLVAAICGLSMSLGAFIAGLLLAETEYRKEVETTVEPFKGLLLGLFFVSVGIGLDLSLLVAKPLQILGLLVGLMVLNGGVIFVLARLFGFAAAAATEIALLLAASGEFSFVVLHSAMSEGLVETQLGQVILVSSTLSMFCIPVLAAAGAVFGRRAAASAEHPPIPLDPTMTPRVLVVGYGRVGHLVAEMLTAHGIPWLAVDRTPKQIEEARQAGHQALYGDASRPEFLQRCGLETALAVVVTMDSPDGTEAVVATARQIRRDLPIVARARDARQAKRLYSLGASDAVPETIEASLQLSESLLVDLGVPMGLVIASIHQRREDYRKELNDPNALGGRARALRNE